MKPKPKPIIITRITPDQLEEYKKTVNKIVYLCDGQGCKRNCKETGFGLCIRTSNEEHAINKGNYNSFELSQYYDFKVLEELEEEPVNEWIPENDRPKSTKYKCSKCGGLIYTAGPGCPIELPVKKCEYPYCPYCLSAMKPYIKILEKK